MSHVVRNSMYNTDFEFPDLARLTSSRAIVDIPPCGLPLNVVVTANSHNYKSFESRANTGKPVQVKRGSSETCFAQVHGWADPFKGTLEGMKIKIIITSTFSVFQCPSFSFLKKIKVFTITVVKHRKATPLLASKS